MQTENFLNSKNSAKQVAAALQKTTLFKNLEGETLRRLAERAVKRNFSCGSVLFFAGDEANGLYVAASGAVRGFRSGGDGREQIIFIERAPATFAEAAVFSDGGGRHYATVVAEEDTLVFCLEKSVVLELCRENPAFAFNCLRVLGRRVKTLTALIEELTLHDVKGRLARFLLGEADRGGETKGAEIFLNLNLTRVQLAARVGTVREVATRNLNALKNEGLIRFENRLLVICDKENLARYANAAND